MSQIFCFKHPLYRGKNKPSLKCNTCCKLYMDNVRIENESRTVDPHQWVDEKIRNLNKQYSR